MKNKEYVAALDIGTSKIVAMAARKNENGSLTLLASEKEPSENCIRRGYIYNADMTVIKINRIIRKLNEQLKNRSLPPLERIYVGIGGQSIHTEWYSIKKAINEQVTQELLDEIEQEIAEYDPESTEIPEILSPEFYVDGELEENPKGTIGAVIEARYPLIVNNQSLKKRLISVLEHKISIIGFNIAPIATAEAVLTKANKESGCALVELGAGVTYLSIYKDDRLKHLVTIPLGASTITKDISSLGVSEKEAEELKIKYGSALIESDNDGKIAQREELKELKDFGEAIEARSDEIIANINAQIENSGYKSALRAGIIITGGGASLRNIQTSLEQKTGIKVSFAQNKCFDETGAEVAVQPEYTTITGLLALSKVNCAKETKPPAQPKEENLFGPPSGNASQTATSEKKDGDQDTKGGNQKGRGGKKPGILDRLSRGLFDN